MGFLRRLGGKLSTKNMIGRNLHQAAGEIEQFFVRMSIVCTGRCISGVGQIPLPLTRRRPAHPKRASASPLNYVIDGGFWERSGIGFQ